MRGKVEVYIKREEVVVGQTVIGRPIMDHWCTAKDTLKTEKAMPEADRIALEIVREVAKERDVRVKVIDISSFNSHKARKTRTNKSNNKANIKSTRKNQFSNTLARATCKPFEAGFLYLFNVNFLMSKKQMWKEVFHETCMAISQPFLVLSMLLLNPSSLYPSGYIIEQT